jgi:hypothetical protein
VSDSGLAPYQRAPFPLAAPLEGPPSFGEREEGGTPDAGPRVEPGAAGLGLGTNVLTVNKEV